ncbi:MAG: AAA family ATPase, partial [Tardiphaga sp.]
SHGAVIYLCREGTRSLKFRLKAWELHRKAALAGKPFYLIEAPINFMQGTDVGVLLATVEAIAAKANAPIASIFVDTVSRVLPGAKENQQEDMSLFVGACELLQHRFQCLVIGVHHTNKNGGIRGSTVIPGAGDFMIETRRESGAKVGSIVLQKVKDGDDGQELPFKVNKIELGDIGGNSSLVVDPDGDAKATSEPSGELPDMVVCREILAGLAQAWFMKMPWCKSVQGDRPAVTMITGRWGLKATVAKRLIDGWMANGIIEYVVYDTRKKLRGYRKVIDL